MRKGVARAASPATNLKTHLRTQLKPTNQLKFTDPFPDFPS